jgi:hypothetical protein
MMNMLAARTNTQMEASTVSLRTSPESYPPAVADDTAGCGTEPTPAEAPIQTDSQSAVRHPLVWMPPTTKPDGSGNQFDRTGQFEVRKTINEKGPTFWAWRGKRLLGYATDKQGAYDFCTASLSRDP